MSAEEETFRSETQQFLSISDYRPDEGNKQKTAAIASSPLDKQVPSSEHAHPLAALFTCLFKGLGLSMYIFGPWFMDNFVFTFVLVILCLAADFWTVKNVTGRLLVGLRWWNEVKEDGSTEWKFESRTDPENVNVKDSRLFWATTFITPAVWILLTVAAFVKFNLKWLPLTIVACLLNGAQLVGYWQCRRDAKTSIQNAVQKGMTTVGMNLMQHQLQQQMNQLNEPQSTQV